MNTPTFRHRCLALGLGLCTLVAATAAGTTSAERPSVPDRSPRPALDDANVSRAITGISLFVIDNSADLDAGINAACPLMSTDQYGFFMGEQGLMPNLAGWLVDLIYYTDVGEGAPGVTCGVDIDEHLAQIDTGAPHGGNLEAIILPDDATFSDVIALIERATLFGPASADIGGELGGVCYTGARAVCVMMWHRAGMVVTSILAGPTNEITQERALALLTSMVPTMVQSLINYADAPPPGTPSTVAAPTTAPASVPPVTAAPVTVAPVTIAPTVPAATIAPVTVPPVTVPAVSVPPISVPVTAGTVPGQGPVSSVPPLVQGTVPATVAVPPTAGGVSTTTTTTGPTPTSTVSTPTSGSFDLVAARATLADFVASNPIGLDVGAGAGITPLCPGSGVASIPLAMTEVGLVPEMSDFRVKVVQSGIAPGLGVVECGGDVIAALVGTDPSVPSHTPLLAMYDITGAATFDQVLAERPGVTLVQSDIPTIGGEIYGGGCAMAPAGVDIGTFCVRIWHREGLVVMIQIGGTGQAGLDTAVTDLLIRLVPEVVNDLATNVNWPTPAAPT